MKTFLAFAFAGAAHAFAIDQLDMEFMRYAVDHGKSYNSVQEYEFRKEQFKAWHATIQAINAEETTSIHGHNFLSDWTSEERDKLLGLKGMNVKKMREQAVYAPTKALATYPTSFDWTAYGVVNPVQDQGNCGSCYAFATVAVLESNYAIAHGVLYKLSEQQIVDCSSSYGNNGCDGGLYSQGWNYAHSKPVATSTTYPYTSGTT